MSEYGLVQRTIVKIVAKMDIPFSLKGIMRGPLSEPDCSSCGFVNFLKLNRHNKFGSAMPCYRRAFNPTLHLTIKSACILYNLENYLQNVSIVEVTYI